MLTHIPHNRWSFQGMAMAAELVFSRRMRPEISMRRQDVSFAVILWGSGARFGLEFSFWMPPTGLSSRFGAHFLCSFFIDDAWSRCHLCILILLRVSGF